MKVFKGVDGAEWQVAVGRESWGGFVAILSQSRGSDPPRQAPLKGRSMEEAYAEIAEMDQDELQALLERSQATPMG